MLFRSYQDRFKFILVDEFQDTNYAQFEVVKLLAAKNRNVAVVGDDDQAIFRFRGASMSNILDFDRTYPDARKVVLQENRRSPQAVLDAAYRLIQHNNPDRLEVAQQIDKRLIARGPDGGERMGKGPEHLAFDTLSSEADHVAAMIADGHAAGQPLKDFAILVRANHDADAFLRALNMGYGQAVYLTAVGDTVHVAARLEALTKDYGCELVISSDVAVRARLDVSDLARHELTLRNRQTPLTVIVAPSAAALADRLTGAGGRVETGP